MVDFAPVLVVICGNKMVLINGRVDFARSLAAIELSQTQMDFAPVIVEFRVTMVRINGFVDFAT